MYYWYLQYNICISSTSHDPFYFGCVSKAAFTSEWPFYKAKARYIATEQKIILRLSKCTKYISCGNIQYLSTVSAIIPVSWIHFIYMFQLYFVWCFKFFKNAELYKESTASMTYLKSMWSTAEAYTIENCNNSRVYMCWTEE